MAPEQRQILKQAPRRSWREFSDLFPEEQDCLAAFLALEAAEVLAGEKPANLIRIVNSAQPCGRNLYELWQRHGNKLLSLSPLSGMVCRSTAQEVLLFLYHPQTLQRRLAGRTAKTFLKRCGYPDQASPSELLQELQARFTRQAIPHEIGFFLGYPLKDVTAFLGWRKSSERHQCGWVVYGKARRSLALAERYARCRNRMIGRLSQSDSALTLLKAPAPEAA